ncbi:MAG: hypothetical protein TEF_00740 [Rhizobiales bacterium NRL2]|jgi:hypothetical protein|nr:MAG: hypothetical protein TEF_00740 [Rhizobiales bacterium NRL2]
MAAARNLRHLRKRDRPRERLVPERISGGIEGNNAATLALDQHIYYFRPFAPRDDADEFFSGGECMRRHVHDQ